MNKFSLIACCLIILTLCVGCYSQRYRLSNVEGSGYHIDGVESFEMNAMPSDESDVGDEELFSFE